MKKILLSILSIILLLSFSPITSLASSLEKLPTIQSSKQWKVVIGKADSPDPELNKSDNPDLYNVYSMDIKSIGKNNIKIVRIEAFRDDISSQMYRIRTVHK